MDDVINVEQNKLKLILIIKEENKNNFTGNANIKRNQNNNIEINSIVKININATSNMENINYNNKNILEDSENINRKENNHKIVKEEININESIKVDGINNKTNNSITFSLIKESNVNDNKSLKINTLIELK
ncbi:hypothetical protein H8356DRAFT_1331143 [Neocallimastix lanati (nom. inval.)]|nr:hypothetical protein H8356DRAFT_1331143 [Neocallimastix sp. JGI-2020a]